MEPQKLLFTLPQRIRILKSFGVDTICVKKFDENIANMDCGHFLHQIVIQELNCSDLVVGEDFLFGKDRQGDKEYLKLFEKNSNFCSHLISPKTAKDFSIKSSNIRNFLSEGKIEIVTQMLGRPYCLEGKIIHGQQNGRKLGFPTLNLSTQQNIILKKGVYAGFILKLAPTENFENGERLIKLSPHALRSVFNIGTRPTFDSTHVSIEGHIIDKDITHEISYDDPVIFYFSHFIRDEKKFNSLEELKTQIYLDTQTAGEKLANGSNPN